MMATQPGKFELQRKLWQQKLSYLITYYFRQDHSGADKVSPIPEKAGIGFSGRFGGFEGSLRVVETNSGNEAEQR